MWMVDGQPALPGVGLGQGAGGRAVRSAVAREGFCQCGAEPGSGCPGMESKEGSGLYTLPFHLQTVM